MHLRNIPSWSITCDIPEELQFGAYRRDISDHHLLLGTWYLQPAQAEVLRTLLKAYIARLV